MSPFAVVVPVGPGDLEVARLHDLLSSLWHYEPSLDWLVLVDDAMPPRRLTLPKDIARRGRIVTLMNPRRGRGYAGLGGLAVGVMSALGWLYRHADPEFVLKLDTDSLVIRPFAAEIASRLRAAPGAGLAGAIGRTCNRHSPDYHSNIGVPSSLSRTLQQWRLLMANASVETQQATGGDLPSDPGERWLFDRVRPRLEAAEGRGYRTLQYCQGGGYVISARMLRTAGALGYWEDTLGWAFLPSGEDVILGMHAYAVGLELLDASSDGEPFGLHWKGLAFGPAELYARGYAIVHSVRNDRVFSEGQIRQFFGAMRTARAGRARDATR